MTTGFGAKDGTLWEIPVKRPDRRTEQDRTPACALAKRFKTRPVEPYPRGGALRILGCVPKKPPLLAHLYLDVRMLAMLSYAMHLRVCVHNYVYLHYASC